MARRGLGRRDDQHPADHPDRQRIVVCEGTEVAERRPDYCLDHGTRRLLRRHRTAMLEARAVTRAEYEVEPLGPDFVFRADRTGRPLNPDLVSKALKRGWAHAGLPPGPTLHGLRHTNGSLLLLNGVPPIQVAAHLGHDLQTLNKVYAHELDPANRQEVIAEAVADIYR